MSIYSYILVFLLHLSFVVGCQVNATYADITPVFFPYKVLNYSYIQSINISATFITIPNWTCNENYKVFDFSRFSCVESIEIGNDCFGSVQTFKIDGLNRLKTLKIGNNSFTQKKNWYGSDKSKSVHILDCEPQLQFVHIGTIGSRSFNFYHSSFVIRGIDMILNI